MAASPTAIAVMLTTRRTVDDEVRICTGRAARAGGFSLPAGIDIAPNQGPKLERLCRYISRPPVATERMALTRPHTATARRTS